MPIASLLLIIIISVIAYIAQSASLAGIIFIIIGFALFFRGHIHYNKLFSIFFIIIGGLIISPIATKSLIIVLLPLIVFGYALYFLISRTFSSKS